MKEKKGIRIERVSKIEICVTLILAVLFVYVMVRSHQEFQVLQTSTEEYIQCEKAARQLQEGATYLTEQVRLYATTQKTAYRDQYFKEANVTRRRENALETLREYFDGTDTFTLLKAALRSSQQLMKTEYYAMRLIAEASDPDPSGWPEEIRQVTLKEEDQALSAEEKLSRAQEMVSDDAYQQVKAEITADVYYCTGSLVTLIRNQQGRATTIFTDMHYKEELGISILIVLMVFSCIVMRRLVVKPLMIYNQRIKDGKIFPVIGAEELQNLARTYNHVYEENQETQKLIRHEAEYDSLTNLLNRGSFEKLQKVYNNGNSPFAMILVDVDIFKSVNDTYGHAVGDEILKKVARLLKGAFRSIDYVCRIGGDEFAIIMVEMNTSLKYTIVDKITAVNQELSEPTDGLPAVSLSVGVAFTDRENPGESIFKDADKALYYIKEHGKHGCGFYGITE